MNFRLLNKFLYCLGLSVLLLPINALAQTAKAPQATPTQSAAQIALQLANSAPVDSIAYASYQSAQLAFTKAEGLMLKRKFQEAERNFVKAKMYAELSVQQMRYMQLKEQLESKASENQKLRRSLFIETGRKP